MKFYLLISMFLFSCAKVNNETLTKESHRGNYKKFSELEAENTEGVDYKVDIQKILESKTLIMAFHGGTIEPGTDLLAKEISKTDISFYNFVGLRDGLHITSTDFDDPRLIELTKEATNCISLHGLSDNEADFCFGGANQDKRKQLLGLFQKEFPQFKSCELCCPPNHGVSFKNPANFCHSTGGVQIEIGKKARNLLLKNKEFLKKVSELIRNFYLESDT